MNCEWEGIHFRIRLNKLKKFSPLLPPMKTKDLTKAIRKNDEITKIIEEQEEEENASDDAEELEDDEPPAKKSKAAKAARKIQNKEKGEKPKRAAPAPNTGINAPLELSEELAHSAKMCKML